MAAQGRVILTTERLLLREMTEHDYGDLCGILQDPKVMYAYEHAFSDEEAREWLQRQLARYQKDGFGLWAVILAETGQFIGECGLTMQDWEGRMVPEIGYHLGWDHWHRGYATEAADGCKRYAFDTLGLPEVFAIIRDSNTASRNVAARLGMQPRGAFTKHYYGMDMPHLVYAVKGRAHH